jgi:anti-sigma factor RsiW
MSASDPRGPGPDERFARDGSPSDAAQHAPQHAPGSADDRLHERLGAHVLDELPAGERAVLDAELERSPALARERARVAATIALAKSAFPPETLSPETLERLRRAAHDARPRQRFTLLRGGRLAGLAVAAGLVLVVGVVALRAGLLGTTEQGRVASHAESDRRQADGLAKSRERAGEAPEDARLEGEEAADAYRFDAEALGEARAWRSGRKNTIHRRSVAVLDGRCNARPTMRGDRLRL